MRSLSIRVPVRADLAGGTLDLWPLYLFHPGARTVNVAISFHTEVLIEETGDQPVEVELTDHDYRARYETHAALSRDPKVSLIARAVEHFNLSGIRITTRTEVPRGSGLGGSSALAVALVRGLSEFADAPLEGEELIALVRDLETRLLGLPAGIQDYYPPVYGGLASLHLEPGAVVRQALRLPLGDLAAHMIIHYSELAHFSGTNNWEIYKRHVDGDRGIREGLSAIARAAAEMERALDAHDLPAAGAALAAEWRARKSIIAGVSTPEIEAAIAAATGAGAWGGKVCGAGGGGCIVILTPAENRERVVRALRKVPGRTLDVAPVPYGIAVRKGGERQIAFVSVERPGKSRLEPIEQLYMATEAGHSYHPHVLVEGAITFDDARHGTHVNISRSLLAPVNLREERIEWDKAVKVDPDRLPLSAVPDPGRKFAVRPADETLLAVTAEGEDSFRQFLEETERLTLFHNAEFGLYSDTGESRDDFMMRCVEHGMAGVDEETDRLERTFRRRLDQMREKQEREDRAIDESEEKQEGPTEVNIAWGQTLYNITRGKPIDDVASSPREEDYLQNISALQRSWERELEAMREIVTEKARQIEEISVLPDRRNIEVRRYVVVWTAGPPTAARRGRSKTGSGRRKRPQV